MRKRGNKKCIELKLFAQTPQIFTDGLTMRAANIIAYTIVKNKDAEMVEVFNLEENKIEKIYKRA